VKNVVLALGTNLGDKRANLLTARELLQNQIGEELRVSKIYNTPSWGFDSYDFLNQVVVYKTALSPTSLLNEVEKIEKALGRRNKTVKKEDNSPIYVDRVIDIDILLYENEVINTSQLIVPHPKIVEREFVLRPLVDIFKDEVIAPFTKSFNSFLTQISCITV